MSIISTQVTKIATLSAATRKAFNAVPIEALLHGVIFREGVTKETAIRPSDIRMTSESALAALGGRMTPASFVQGLVFAAARYAHGNVINATGLPSGSLTALNATLGLIKKGAGISALSLETAVLKGIEALLALPAPVARKKVVDLGIVKATSVTLCSSETDEPHWSTFTGPINRDADDALVEATANAAIDAAAAAEAAATAKAAAANAALAEKFEQDAATSAATLITRVTSRRDAEAISRAIAQALGFRLVKMPAKKAA